MESRASTGNQQNALPPVNNISDTEDMDDEDSDSQDSVRVFRTARRRLHLVDHLMALGEGSDESSVEEGRIPNNGELQSVDNDSENSNDSELTLLSDQEMLRSPGTESISSISIIDSNGDSAESRSNSPDLFVHTPDHLDDQQPNPPPINNLAELPPHPEPEVVELTSTDGDEPIEILRTNQSEAATEAVVLKEEKTSTKLKISKKCSGHSTSSNSDKEDEGQTCSICFELWSNSGEHRLSSLKCGHIFGKSCIERWLKGKDSRCPQCNAKAVKKDVRVLYAKALKAVDTTEKDRLSEELSKVKKDLANLEREKARQLMKNELDNQLIRKLQEELRMLKASVGNDSSSLSINEKNQSPYKLTIAYYKTFNVVKDGASRVMAFNEWMNMLVVSINSQIGIFPGYGIKKINVLDMRSERYVHLHSKQIRDLAFNPDRRDLLLSVSLDKTVKITNVSNNAIVHNYVTNQPLWSCCWNADKPSEFFVGTATGCLHRFDIKNTNEAPKTYDIKGSGPVVSLSYIPLNQNAEFYFSGLLVTRLTSISFIEILEADIKEHLLPVEGPFVHTSFDVQSRHFLTTCRPTQNHLHARHILCQLHSINISADPTVINNVISAQEIHVFKGSTTMKVLARACLISNPISKPKSFAIFSEESNLATKLFDLSSANQIQVIKSTDNVIDILPIRTFDSEYVALLDEKNVKLYKWIEKL